MNQALTQTTLHEQEFTYRSPMYTPQAPVAGFVNFLSKQYYGESDESTVEVIRRFMGEFTNDTRLRMALSVFSNKQHGNGRTLMNEQYSAFAEGDKMFTVSMVSGDDLQVPDFTELKTACLHPVKKAADRYYQAGMSVMDLAPKTLSESRRHRGTILTEEHIQFVSIYHQLQNLVRTLSAQCKFYAHYDAKSEKYYVMARPLDQADKKYADGQKREDDRYQVLIMLHIPPVAKPVQQDA